MAFSKGDVRGGLAELSAEESLSENYASCTAGLPVSYTLEPHWDDVITWSHFKSETSFGFLSPNFTGHDVVVSCC